MTKTKLPIIAALLLLVSLGSATAARAADPPLVILPVNQALPGIGAFAGQLAVQQFKVVNNQLVAVGLLTGQITGAGGAVLGNIATLINVPVTATGTCDILHLELGPLHLNLLGLVVDLNKIVLDISAQPGAGNLLGNLLCDVANALNGGHGNLAELLKQLLKGLT